MSNKIKYKFADSKLFELALTHRSHSGSKSNERLEFLGDAVLDLVITDHIYLCYPDLSEGKLAKMRSGIVCATSLVDVAQELEVGEQLNLGESENVYAEVKPSILADAMEAIIGAIYLDGGLLAVKPLILEWFEKIILEAAQNPGETDYKSRLQELATKIFDSLPNYEITSEGPDHNKFFYAKVMICEDDYGEGKGSSKKEATQCAAKQAYEKLQLTQ